MDDDVSGESPSTLADGGDGGDAADDAEESDEGGPDGGRDPDDGPGDTPLSLDEVFGVLSHPVRRDVLSVLSSADDAAVSIVELVDELVARETDRRGTRPDRDDVTVSLFHVHVPKLAGLGIVEYDEYARILRYRGDPRLERWLTEIRDEDLDEGSDERDE